MNEFTKEELNAIADGLRIMYKNGFDQGYGIAVYDLHTKIQSMIDNYCDHTWSDGSGNFIVCVKCHLIWGRR